MISIIYNQYSDLTWSKMSWNGDADHIRDVGSWKTLAKLSLASQKRYDQHEDRESKAIPHKDYRGVLFEIIEKVLDTEKSADRGGREADGKDGELRTSYSPCVDLCD